MKIAIDIDDTITNTKENQIKLWKEYIKKNPNPNYNTKLPNNINEFNSGKYIDTFWDTYREQLSFHSIYKKDVGTIIDKLKKDGHEVCIVTSRPDNKYKDLKQRIYNGLRENNINIENIYTNALDKGIFCKQNNFDLLIDDNIKQIKSAHNNNILGILFNLNKTYKGLQTTKWKELYKIIKELNK